MARVQWARASQFNWAFDNMGGTPLQEAAAGAWHEAVAAVAGDGTVSIAAPLPGGGQVYYLRGVWRAETQFPWDGFWAAPMAGDLVNYYEGGSFDNQGESTVVTLGTPLAAGDAVQLYYVYLTGETATKYEALTAYPCIRRAYRGRDDYTYDFAVDRLLDLMAALHLAGRERGRDYQALIRFIWDVFAARQASRTSPLFQDSFERQDWQRGPYLMYRGATAGLAAFEVFQSELAPDAAGRRLHVRVDLPATQDAAWFGYGLDWSLGQAPFSAMDRLSLTVQGGAKSRRVHNLVKQGSGSATLVLLGDYAHQEPRRFVVEIETSGEVGAATFKWSKDGGQTWEATGLVSGDAAHALPLWGGLSVYWESGVGQDLAAGDYWAFWGGEPAVHPRRLLLCLNDSAPQDADPWGPGHTYVHALPDRFAEPTALEIPFSQFWRRDYIIEDGDRAYAMWGAWYAASQPGDCDIAIGQREETLTFAGDAFYTQRQVSWNLSPYATAFGVWAGIDTGRCNSAGRSTINFLIYAAVDGVTVLPLRLKVKDANGSYFYKDLAAPVYLWERLTVNLADMLLESGSGPMTHPLQLVDLGVPQSPPAQGAFYLTDLKFDEPARFSTAARLRVLEFKVEQQGLAEHEWWLDDVALNLEAADPYPLAPRLAISLTATGQNPWRGPTLVHYAHPLAPQLAPAPPVADTYVQLHQEAQAAFNQRYGGLAGPVIPAHTRNDVENIALCGEEDFGRFTWWPRHRDHGATVGFWHFNAALSDASGRGHGLTWQGGGNAAYAPGLCQPGDAAVDLDGSHYLSAADHADLNLGAGDFTLEMVVKPATLADGARLMSKRAAGEPGYELILGAGGLVQLVLADASGESILTPSPALYLDTSVFHVVSVAVDRDGDVTFCVDGDLGSMAAARPGSLDNSRDLALGRRAVGGDFFQGQIDLARLYKGLALSGAEMPARLQIIRGELNGSAYPELGNALGQYWAFLRLAQYYFVSRDAAAWEVLDKWLAWLNAFGQADGAGWRFPANFSEYGFTYGGYDPGAAASVALGCLYVYLRNGDARAGLWARRILDDLRLNRWDPAYGGYKSDRHYAWLNGLALQVFGLAMNGAAGQAYPFAATAQDEAHFQTLWDWVMANAGDAKPNVLNADGIPFTYSEDADLWDHAPHYLAMRQMGTLEGVTAMLAAALEYAKAHGDWQWWDNLLGFMVQENFTALGQAQLRSLTAAYDHRGARNLVRVYYAGYDHDPTKYAEARDEAAVASWGEQALDLDCRYGAPVVLESPEMAALLAQRLLARLKSPQERLEAETWLEGARLELGDAVAVTSDFHGLEQAKFSLWGKEVDLARRRVRLSLARPLESQWAWAVDCQGGPYDAWAIDWASEYDAGWEFRAYAG